MFVHVRVFRDASGISIKLIALGIGDILRGVSYSTLYDAIFFCRIDMTYLSKSLMSTKKEFFMKQHFQPHVKASTMALSLEEAAILLDEVQTNNQEINQCVDQAERLTCIENGISDVTAIVDASTSNADDADLIAAVGDMTVAGTEIDPSSFIPVTDGDNSIAVEDLKESASKVLDGIKNALAQAWNAIEQFFSKWFTFMGFWKARVAELERRASAVVSTTLKDNTPLTISGTSRDMLGFTHENKLVTGPGLKQAVQEWSELAIATFETMPNVAMNIAKTVTGVANGFRVEENMEKQVNGAVDKLGPLSIDYFDCFAKWHTSSIDDQKFSTNQVMGKMSISVLIPSEADNQVREQNGTDTWDVRLNAFSKMKAKATVSEYNGLGKKFKMDMPEFSVVKEMIAALKALIQPYERFKAGVLSKEMRQVGMHMQQACQKATSVARSDTSGNDAAQKLVDILNSYNVSYANWCKEPMTGIMYAFMNSVYSQVELADQLLTRYEKA